MDFRHGDVLEVTHGIERRVAEQSADITLLPFDAETSEESVHRISHAKALAQRHNLAASVGESCRTFASVYADACHRAEGNEREAVLATVEVGALEQCRLGIDVAYFKVYAYGRMQIARHLFTYCLEMIVLHRSLLFFCVLCMYPYPCRRVPRRSAPPHPPA